MLGHSRDMANSVLMTRISFCSQSKSTFSVPHGLKLVSA